MDLIWVSLFVLVVGYMYYFTAVPAYIVAGVEIAVSVCKICYYRFVRWLCVLSVRRAEKRLASLVEEA